MDFSRLTNDTPELLQLALEDTLTEVASAYRLTLRGHSVKAKFSNLVADMTQLGNNYEPKIVVLIDEYDAPIVHLAKGSDLEKANIKVMEDFFMTLKSLNKHFKFTFITGVSKFSLSDVFSGANHLDDITIDASADAMFGYTKEEITRTFSLYLEGIALEWSKGIDKKITKEMIMERMAFYYNGYRFYEKGASVYNPWSTLKFFKGGKLENYWYESGSPTILINQMLEDPDRFDFNIDNL